MKELSFSLILIILILYPLGQLEKIPLFIPSVSIYWHDLIIVMVFLSGVIAFRGELKKIIQLPLITPLVGFMVFSSLSLILNPLKLTLTDLLISSAYLARFSLYLMLYPFIYLLVSKLPFRGKLLLHFLFFSGVILAVLGLGQYFLYPNLRNLYYLGWDPHQFRLFSTLLDPNFTGIVLVLTFLLGFYLLNYGSKLKLMSKGFLLIILVALILTYSRASYLSLLFSLPIMLRKKFSWVNIFLLYLIFLIIVLLLPRPFGEGVRLERISTIKSRIESYQKVISVIKKYPIFGVGFNSYRYAQHDMGFLPQTDWQEIHSGAGTDNSFLFAWATSGIGGFLSLIFFVIMGFKHRMFAQNIVKASLIAVIIHSFFVNSFFYPWVMIWLWILLGVNAGLGLVKKC